MRRIQIGSRSRRIIRVACAMTHDDLFNELAKLFIELNYGGDVVDCNDMVGAWKVKGGEAWATPTFKLRSGVLNIVQYADVFGENDSVAYSVPMVWPGRVKQEVRRKLQQSQALRQLKTRFVEGESECA